MSDFLRDVSEYDRPLIIVISEQEVLDKNIQPVLTLLKKLVESPDIAKKYKENVEITFHGYNDAACEL